MTFNYQGQIALRLISRGRGVRMTYANFNSFVNHPIALPLVFLAKYYSYISQNRKKFHKFSHVQDSNSLPIYAGICILLDIAPMRALYEHLPSMRRLYADLLCGTMHTYLRYLIMSVS